MVGLVALVGMILRIRLCKRQGRIRTMQAMLRECILQVLHVHKKIPNWWKTSIKLQDKRSFPLTLRPRCSQTSHKCSEPAPVRSFHRLRTFLFFKFTVILLVTSWDVLPQRCVSPLDVAVGAPFVWSLPQVSLRHWVAPPNPRRLA